MATATRIIQRLRNFLVGHFAMLYERLGLCTEDRKEWMYNLRNLQAKLNNRTVDEIVSRTIPEPNLPEGCSHKLAANYYYTRDGRRELNPPTVVYSQTKLLNEPQQEESASPATETRKVVTPGVMRQWKLSTDEPFL